MEHLSQTDDDGPTEENSRGFVNSPIFNYNSIDDDSPVKISPCQDDLSLQPALPELRSDQRYSRWSVISVVDNLLESDFHDQGCLPDRVAEDIARIMQQIKQIVLFEGYDDEELQLVTDYMYLRPVKQGEVVIEFDSVGDAIYVIKRGKFSCTVPTENGAQIPVRTYCDEGYFGELALINHAPRAANITAVTDGELWVLNALRSAWLRKRRAISNAELFEQVIKAIPLFQDSLNPGLVSRLVDALEVVTMTPGTVICTLGEPGDAMYFIMVGEVEAFIDDRLVRVMHKNEFFGERALVLEEGRAATCRAQTQVKLAKLPKESFALIIPDCVVHQMRCYIAANY